MSYLKEANRLVRRKYGHYCNNCRDNNKTPMTYTEFKKEEYYKLNPKTI